MTWAENEASLLPASTKREIKSQMLKRLHRTVRKGHRKVMRQASVGENKQQSNEETGWIQIRCYELHSVKQVYHRRGKMYAFSLDSDLIQDARAFCFTSSITWPTCMFCEKSVNHLVLDFTKVCALWPRKYIHSADCGSRKHYHKHETGRNTDPQKCFRPTKLFGIIVRLSRHPRSINLRLRD